MDIEILDINNDDNWSKGKKLDFDQVKVITARVIDKKIDITNGFTEDLNSVVAVYARYANDDAKLMLWNIAKLSAKFDEEKLSKSWAYFIVDNQLKTNNKLVKICKALDIDTTIKTDGNLDTADELAVYLKPGVDPKFVLEHGFYAYVKEGQTGYYFRTGDKTFSAQSNFVVEPLMHVYSKGDNKRIIGIDNGFKKTTLDMASRQMISLDQFTACCYEEGNFMFWGSKIHLMRILNTINDKFPQCYELKTLGWQPEGFFAWSNAVYNPKTKSLEEFNDLGIVEIDDTKYFSPSISSIYRNQRAEDDEHENDRYLSYKKSAVTFSEWATLFNSVYPGLSIYGIGFIFIALFKDLIYKIDNNCPHLSAYGEKGSGKSKFAESISAIFLNDLQPFNLNHGTDFAFFNRLSRFKNCVTWFDEFDDAAIKEDRFQSIKGAYDGAGRERGKGNNKNRTEIAKVNSTLLLTGQYLSTRDDNAALSRCIILPFVPNNDRTPEQIKNYEGLKRIEKLGLTSLVPEILSHRAAMEVFYAKNFPVTFSELRELVNAAKGQYKERVLRNYTAIANCYKYFCSHLTMPFTYSDVLANCVKDVIRLSTLISESDSLADFWNSVEYLLESKEIYNGYNFKIITQSVFVINKDGNDQTITFETPKKILYIRLNTIHKLYLESYRKQTGKTGINKQSLELYISSSKSYLGKNSSQRFTDIHGASVVTSSYVFNYDLLAVPLERDHNSDEQIPEVEIEGFPVGAIEFREFGGKPMLFFTLKSSKTYKKDEKLIIKELFTKISSQNLQLSSVVENMQMITCKGQLKENEYIDKEGIKKLKRSMVASSIKLKDSKIDGFVAADDIPEF